MATQDITTADVRGRLLRLGRWPVKALAGEFLTEADIDREGVAGDRRRTVVDLQTGRHLTAAEHPALLRWTATSAALTDAQGRSWNPDAAGTARALGAEIGRPVTIRPHDRPQHFYPGTVLITVEGSRLALERRLGRRVDLRRFRSNLHLELDSPPFAECDWTGRLLRVGDAVFDIRQPCDRCVIAARDPETGEKWPQLLQHLRDHHHLFFGIFASPRHEARIAVGDPATVEAPGMQRG